MLYDDSRTFCPTLKIAKAVKSNLLGWYESEYTGSRIKASKIRIEPVEFRSDGGLKVAACRVAYRVANDEALGWPWWNILKEGVVE